jgi:hypothetical protein
MGLLNTFASASMGLTIIRKSSNKGTRSKNPFSESFRITLPVISNCVKIRIPAIPSTI